MTATKSTQNTAKSAILVALGILLSRCAGLIRDRVFAHYFGNSAASDVFRAAFRIPNFLQNLFGEGVLSASFIPTYVGLITKKNVKDAQILAWSIFFLLGLFISLLVILGVFFSPWLVNVIAPGFTGEKHDLAVQLVRVFFPGTGLLVLSAWCLGILNSHGKFFLSYASPILWNLAIILSLIIFGNTTNPNILVVYVAWAAVIGSALQMLVQLPSVLRCLAGVKFSLHINHEVQTVLKNFVPACVGRGVVQFSAFIDTIIASWLPTGALSTLSYTQTLYMLPVSLFGMSISVAELPAMSAIQAENLYAVHAQLRERLNNALRRVAFFIVPSAIAFLTLGDVIAAAIYQTGRFTKQDAVYVWWVLSGAAIGLLASTLGRLYASVFYALKDTSTPFKIAILRVSMSACLAYLLAIWVPKYYAIHTIWAAGGITLASSVATWFEYSLLRYRLNRTIGTTGVSQFLLYQLVISAACGAEASWLLKPYLLNLHAIILAILLLACFGGIYLLLTAFWEVNEAKSIVNILLRNRIIRRVLNH